MRLADKADKVLTHALVLGLRALAWVMPRSW